MEARDTPAKIRPLSPDMPEGPALEQARPLPDRRWIPIAFAAVALILFGAIAGLYGGTETEEPAGGGDDVTATTLGGLGGQPPPTTTTTTVPPTLGERVPLLERSARIVYLASDGVSTSQVTWTLVADAPGTAASTGAAAGEAVFDASHRSIFMITPGQRDTLWVGLPPIAEPVFVDVNGAAWHPTTPLTLAFVGRPPGADTPHLYRAEVLPSTEPAALTDLGPVPPHSRLVGWGDWGFVLDVFAAVGPIEVQDSQDVSGSGSVQHLGFGLILDPTGAPTHAFAGTPTAVGPDGRLVVRTAHDELELAISFAGTDPLALGITTPLTTLPRPPVGEPFVVLGPDLADTGVSFGPMPPATSFHFTPDGGHIAAVGTRAGRFVIVTVALDGGGRRQTSIDGAEATLGYSRDGSLLIMRDADGGIVFHDWNRGATFHIPFALGTVLAVDV